MSDLLKRTQIIRREIFDPRKKEHLESLKIFLQTGNWGDIQFYAELPYIEVPMTVLTKYSTYMLKVETETRTERQERIASLNLEQFVEQSLSQREQALAKSNQLMNSMLLETS